MTTPPYHAQQLERSGETVKSLRVAKQQFKYGKPSASTGSSILLHRIEQKAEGRVCRAAHESTAPRLAAAGVRLQAVEARSSVRDRLRSEGVEEKLGGINRFTSVVDAVEAFQTQKTA